MGKPVNPQLQAAADHAANCIEAYASAQGWLDTAEAIGRYLRQGIPPGSFTRLFLQGEYRQAARIADLTNKRAFGDMLVAMSEWMPEFVFGTPEKVRTWLKMHEEARGEG